MHACVKTVEKVLNNGGDPSHTMKHLKFVLDKVSKGCFNFEAIAGYDQAVTDRVELEGYSLFSIIETEEVFSHFSVENTVKKIDKSSKGVKVTRYLCHSELKCDVGEVIEDLGDSSDRTDNFSKGSVSEKVDFNVNVNIPVHVFTTSVGSIVKVYDDCVKGVCSCNYKLQREILQLKPCRFAYLVSLGTAECKKAYEPLVSDITEGFKVVDDSMDLGNMHYEYEDYKSVYDPANKAKLDSIIGKELAEGYLKIIQEKPTCIHSIGAVPKPDGGIRPITDCSMPRDISVNNYVLILLKISNIKV